MRNYKYEFIFWEDYLLFFVYLLIVLFIANSIKKKRIDNEPLYKYFITGLALKIIGGIAFTLIYVYHYGGGDTSYYFRLSSAMGRLFWENTSDFFEIIGGEQTRHTLSYFSYKTGYPPTSYFLLKPESYIVSAITIPFSILGANKFFTTIVLMNTFCYIGIWKFFKMICNIYPNLTKQFAIAILFIPSSLFWGSGIMKDTYTFTAALWFTYSLYQIFIKRDKIAINILIMILTVWTITTIKPYIFVVLMPGSLLWIFHNTTKSINNKLMRSLLAPLIIFLGLMAGNIVISLMGDSLGMYSSFSSIIEKAIITQQDLIRSEQYGDNFFDIGQFDASLGSMLSKAPTAITAGLFRPFLWEARNIVMLISGLENTIMLLASIFILVKVGPLKTIKYIRSEPLLLFSIIFSIFFAFAVGLTTANFGALVRYRIPALPFFTLSLFILYSKIKESGEEVE